MLSIKNLKRILDYQTKRTLIDEGFISEEEINPDKIKIVRQEEQNGNYHNKVRLSYD